MLFQKASCISTAHETRHIAFWKVFKIDWYICFPMCITLDLLLYPWIFCRYLTRDILLLCLLYILFLCVLLLVHTFSATASLSCNRGSRLNCVFLAQFRDSSDGRSGVFCGPYLRRRQGRSCRSSGGVVLGLLPVLAFLGCPCTPGA